MIPLYANGSVLYTFTDNQFTEGSFGFSLLAPDYVQVNSRGFYSFTANQMLGCDTSANPSYTCAGGSFSLSYNAVDVTLALLDPRQSGPGSTDSVDATFVGASLTREGTTIGLYPGPGDKVTALTIRQVADPVAAPEPGTLLATLTGLTLAGALGRTSVPRKRGRVSHL